MDKKEELIRKLENISNADIDKEMTILFDGKQFMIKIPKEVSEFLKIKKGDKFRFIIEIPEDKNEEPIKTDIFKLQNEKTNHYINKTLRVSEKKRMY